MAQFTSSRLSAWPRYARSSAKEYHCVWPPKGVNCICTRVTGRHQSEFRLNLRHPSPARRAHSARRAAQPLAGTRRERSAAQSKNARRSARDAHYRQAIDTVNSTAPKVRRICNAGGGRIGALDVYEAQQSASAAVGWLGRAMDLLPPVTARAEATPVAPRPTVTPIPQKIALSDLLLQTRDQIRGVGGMLDGAQTNLDATFGSRAGQNLAVCCRV